MINKAGLLGITSLMLSTSCWAGEFYAGFGVGPTTTDFKQTAIITVVTNIGTVGENILDKRHFAGKGWFGSLFAGYGMRFGDCDSKCGNFYLAVEANVDARTVKSRMVNYEFIHNNLNDANYKMGRSLGISLLPGYLLTDCTLFYARVGYDNGKFRIKTTENTIGDLNRNLKGFRYGVGVRQSITECFAVRMDYSHTNYKHIKRYRFDPVGTTTKITHFRPESDRLELGVIFTF